MRVRCRVTVQGLSGDPAAQQLVITFPSGLLLLILQHTITIEVLPLPARLTLRAAYQIFENLPDQITSLCRQEGACHYDVLFVSDDSAATSIHI